MPLTIIEQYLEEDLGEMEMLHILTRIIYSALKNELQMLPKTPETFSRVNIFLSAQTPTTKKQCCGYLRRIKAYFLIKDKSHL